MESDLSGLRDESDLELTGQTDQIAGGFPLLRDVPQAGDCHEDTKTRRNGVPLCLCASVFFYFVPLSPCG